MSDQPDGMSDGRWLAILRNLVLPIGLLAVIVGGLWYWESRGGGIGDDYGAVELPAEKNPTDRDPAPEVGRAGPDFELERPEGGTLRLSDLQGQPVILNFWASWCTPCRAEMPELVAAYAEHQAAGLQILAVNLQEPDKTVLNFAEDFGLEFPIVVDRDGELRSVWRLGGVFGGIPSTYFIDEIGIVRAIEYGTLTKSTLDEQIDLLLKGPA